MAAADVAGIFARDAPALDRYVQIGVAQGRVISVSFPSEPDAEAASDHELLDRIASYLDGERDDFEDVTVALTVPTDQRNVLDALRGIPYGEDTSIAQLTRMCPGLSDENQDDLDLARDALRGNPAPIFIPDHRVTDGPSAAPADVVDTLRSIEGL